MVEIKTAGEIDAMAAAGRITAQALAAAREAASVGVTLLELDAVAAEVISAAGASALFLNYRPATAPTPFPGAICASVNDAVVHGIRMSTGFATVTWSASTAARDSTVGVVTPPSASLSGGGVVRIRH